ncbi:hypothetical protein HDV00_004549 [Rhizophlyctis rosea]|nr:hypothetical protein HDV00_004549 [Rhizophlyctis rosea]
MWTALLLIVGIFDLVLANFLKCDQNDGFKDWSWAVQHGLADPSTYPAPLPSTYPLLADVWTATGAGGWDAFHLRADTAPYASSTNNVYKTLTINIYSNTSLDNIWFDLTLNSTTDTQPGYLPAIFGMSSLPVNQWNSYTFNLDTYYAIKNWQLSSIVIKFPQAASGHTIWFFAYMGNPADFTYVPRYEQLPYYVNGVSRPLTNDGLTFTSYNDTMNLDTGLIPQWSCVSNGARRPFADLIDVPLQAWRDTTTGPVPMNMSAGIRYVENTMYIYNMWGAAWSSYWMPFNAADYPNPVYACMIFNADFYVIGNLTTATKTIYVWAPFFQEQQNVYLAAFADYYKAKKGAGTDIAIYVRQQFPTRYWPKEGWFRDFSAIGVIDFNCNATGIDRWLCPDILFFTDTELGILNDQKDVLTPLSETALKYYKKTGFEPGLDMEPVVKSLVYTDNVLYALPAHIISPETWYVNADALTAAHLQLPPPLTNWGSAWWENWNMAQFNSYLKAMYDNNQRGVFMLPPKQGRQTVLASKMSNFYGGSLFTTDGRCGMDAQFEKALNETIVYWNSMPGLMAPLVPRDQDLWAKWLADDEASWVPSMDHPNWVGTWQTPGFDAENCVHVPGCKEIYPPTGTGYVQALLMGIPKHADADSIYEVLVTAIARNSRLAVNAPQGSHGIFGWRTARYTPELAITPSPKAFDYGLMDHATFAGYPAEQKPAWSSVSQDDPMRLAFLRMTYKNWSAARAIQAACQTVNWDSRPPCTSAQWNVTLLDNTSNNQATVNYTWVSNVDTICRTDLVTAQQPLKPIYKYAPSSKVYGTSAIGKGMLAVSILGILIELGLVGGFLWWRDQEVIRAAAFGPSMLILFGGISTLISVIMRISFDGKLSWPQCFGTYWFFAIGFSSLLGALAMKSYRIDRIFRSKGRMVAISPNRLMAMIMTINLGNVIFCLMYQFMIVDKDYAIVSELPNTNFVLTQEDCPKLHSAPTVLLYLYNAALMVLAAYYAFRTRNVVSSFNESLFTAAAILLISVVTIVIVPVLQLVEEAQISLLLIGLGTFLATVLSTLIFAVPKLLMAAGIINAPNVRDTGMAPSGQKSTVPTGGFAAKTQHSGAKTQIQATVPVPWRGSKSGASDV